MTGPNPHEEGNGATVLSMGPEQLQQLKNEAARGRPYANRISLALAIRLAGSVVSGGPYFHILHELDFLEGLRDTSRTVAATQFKHSPLHPLWHKHFATSSHIPANMHVRWGLSGDKGNKDFVRMVQEVASQHANDAAAFSAVLAHRVVSEGWDDRARKGAAARVRECLPGENRERGLTGDWIIYGKHEGRNYYLDLASHAEGENPEELFEKLRRGCAAEFPFFFGLL